MAGSVHIETDGIISMEMAVGIEGERARLPSKARGNTDSGLQPAKQSGLSLNLAAGRGSIYPEHSVPKTINVPTCTIIIIIICACIAAHHDLHRPAPLLMGDISACPLQSSPNPPPRGPGSQASLGLR